MINYVKNKKGTKHIDNLDAKRKLEVIKENLHKFSYDEIYDFFTGKKY